MTKITTFLMSLLEALSLLARLVKMIEEAKREGWIQNGRELVFRIEKAVSDEERAKLAKDMADHYSNMPGKL